MCGLPRRFRIWNCTLAIVAYVLELSCAGGPLEYPHIDIPNPPVLPDEAGVEHTIAPWDNDGIVNTASMLWPNLKHTRLVNADHMDIVGHYKRVRSNNTDSGREYDSYDLLKSGSGFNPANFEKVWDGVFDFCVGIGDADRGKSRLQ